MKDRGPRLLATLLAVAGFVVSGVLEYVHAKTYLAPATDSFCKVGADFDCGAVALSRLSVILAVPLPVWGAAGFWAMGVAAWRKSKLLLPLATVATLASAGLLAEELLHVGSICLLCEGVHALSLLLLIVALWWRKTFTNAIDRDTIVSGLVLPAALPLLAMVAAPRYWQPLTWQDEVPHATGVTEDGHPWVGAQEPVVVVHEFIDYGCPHCALASNRMRMRLVSDGDEIRVVRRHEPRMRCKTTNRGCIKLRAALCAGEQDAFWRMDSWLFVHAPGNANLDTVEGARSLGLDTEAFARCLEAEETYQQADAHAREARKLRIRATPTYIVDGEKYEPGQIQELLDDRL